MGNFMVWPTKFLQYACIGLQVNVGTHMGREWVVGFIIYNQQFEYAQWMTYVRERTRRKPFADIDMFFHLL